VKFRAKLPQSDLSLRLVVAIAMLALALFGFLDYLTGYEVSFAVFYLAPVTLAAWYAGRRWGVTFALGSSLVWYAAEIAAGYPYSHLLIPVWNAGVRFVFFLVIGLLLSSLRDHLLAERRLARTDDLTGLLNTRAFLSRLEQEVLSARRTRSPITLAYVDLDDFKSVNDTHGHAEGDRVLRAVARILQKSLRQTDAVARLGGDEFALILPATNLDGATTVINNLLLPAEFLQHGLRPVTCSIGAIVFQEPPGNVAQAIAAADVQMYSAKKAGKNVRFIKESSESGSDKSHAALSPDATSYGSSS
jgi:diguanylate cyclase (GGDEF)-like protein